MSQISSESDDQVLRYWGLKSDLNNSDRQTDRETDIQRYRALPRSEPKIESPVAPTTFKIVERIIYFSPEGYMIELWPLSNFYYLGLHSTKKHVLLKTFKVGEINMLLFLL